LKNHGKKKLKFGQDPLGFFVIKVDEEKRKIVVEFRRNDGRKTPYIFEGEKAEELYRKILAENLIKRLDHAAYLGKELYRAEECLKKGEKYIQDSG